MNESEDDKWWIFRSSQVNEWLKQMITSYEYSDLYYIEWVTEAKVDKWWIFRSNQVNEWMKQRMTSYEYSDLVKWMSDWSKGWQVMNIQIYSSERVTSEWPNEAKDDKWQSEKQQCSVFMCLCSPRLSADSWKHTDATAVKLVATPCSNNLKVECLIKLSTIIRAESQLDSDLTLGWNHPSVSSAQYIIIHTHSTCYV